jgi:hypothetical protein
VLHTREAGGKRPGAERRATQEHHLRTSRIVADDASGCVAWWGVGFGRVAGVGDELVVLVEQGGECRGTERCVAREGRAGVAGLEREIGRFAWRRRGCWRMSG